MIPPKSVALAKPRSDSAAAAAERRHRGAQKLAVRAGGSRYNAPTMSTVDRIKAAAEEARRRGEHPHRVHLTVDDGRKLQFELMTGNPKLGHRIEKQGVRNAVRKVAGLEVVWRSPEFKVE